MNVSIVGQTSVLGDAAPEQRIQALARTLAVKGHILEAFSATERHIRRADGLAVRYTPSFSPETPGGWLYTIISLMRSLGPATDVVHIHGWKAAALMPLAALIRPKATFVWTIDSVPKSSRLAHRLVMWSAARLCDAITVPNRALQYHIRGAFGVLAAYVPDGYTSPTVADMATSRWGLRKKQYTLVVGNDTQALRAVCLAYKDTKRRKKLTVLVGQLTSNHTRLAKRYSFLRLIESTSLRQRSSLIRQAERVLLLDGESGQELLLAMDANVPMLAANHPLLQEIAGTTVQFFARNDRTYLAQLLKSAAGSSNRKARIRARAHFSWSRIVEEYETLYHYPQVVRVPVDSIRPSRLTHGEVY